MKGKVTTIVVIVLIVAWFVTAILASISTSNQISNQQAQIARLQGQVAAEKSLVTSQESKLGGSHRDLITCGDFNNLITKMNDASDSNGDTIYWVGGTTGNYTANVSLPAHCLNN